MYPLGTAGATAKQADLRETARLDRCCGAGTLRPLRKAAGPPHLPAAE